ncbi:MAG: LysM peptidoglycan-binding domain-containing protein, partial [Firmicutes bacterium]|nr:LysM peptidoglycan-binding domain-containing protein [Bacillota bacterium]
MTIYTVQPGDTVYSIARAANTTPELIISQNELTDPDLIMPGQTLVILYPELTYTVKPKD